MINSASRPLRTALIGLGRIGWQFHAPAVRAHPGFVLVGTADPLPERRAEAEVAFSAPAFASLAEVLRTTAPDLVVVASPTSFHAEHTCAAFAAGAHVFCDKPVARSVDELDRMIAAADAADRKLVAYQPYRLFSRSRALAALLERGTLGPLHLVKASICNYVRRNDWQAFLAHGGGMLNNYASHALDEVLHLLRPREIRSVFCQTRCVATLGDAEDVVKALLVTDEGCVIDLEISQAHALAGPPWQVVGAFGAAGWDADARHWRVRWFDPAAAPPPEPQTALAAAGRRYPEERLPWREETISAEAYPDLDYYDMLHAHLVHGAPAPASAGDARRLLSLLERCRASAAGGRAT